MNKLKLLKKLNYIYKIIVEYGLKKGITEIFKKAKNLIFKTYNYANKNLLMMHAKIRSNNGLLLKNIQGSKMYIDINDPGISTELLLTGIHEPRTTNLVKRILNKGMVVIDLGANIGYYALMESSIVGNSGVVYAIEPVAKNFQMLSKSILENNFNNIKTFNTSISDKIGTAKFFLTDASNWV